MTSFELIFFVFVVCPVITNNIRTLINSYKSENEFFDPSILIVLNVLNDREYQLINNFNFNNYLIIIILIFLLISLFFYLYAKIGILEKIDPTEAAPDITPRSSSEFTVRTGSRMIESSLGRYEQSISRNSNITRSSTIKFIYLRHAIRCGLSTIACLIFYQIFFYYYGHEFKYIGTENEMIVLFVESIS